MTTHIRISLKLFMTICLISGALFFLCCAPAAVADDDNHRYKKRNKDIGTTFNHVKNEDKNEATGQAAAWMLAAANLNVLISLLIRGTRFAALPA